MAKSIEDPRNARSQRTRAALLAAVRGLLEEEGYEALTMAAVAERAGVSRRAIYLHFNSRSELAAALFDYVGEQEGLADSLRRVWESPDAVAALDEWARHLARYHPRILAVDRAVDRVRQVDSDAAQHRAWVNANQQRAARTLAGWLYQEGRLAAPWTVDTATDMLWALMGSDVTERLIVEQQWPPERFAEHLAVLFRATFVCEPD